MSALTFRLGWDDGAQARATGGSLISPREAETRHPSLNGIEIAVYLNGFEDGFRGDTFRLDGGIPCSSS